MMLSQKLNNMKKKNGFTLVEVVVSMSIIFIVLGFCAAMVLSISKISAKREYDELCLSEYQSASNLIQEYKNAYNINEYSLFKVDESEIVIKKDESEFSLKFNETEKTLTAQVYNYSSNRIDTKNLTFKNIIKIEFASYGDMVKCTYKFQNFTEYANLLNFGVNQWL